MRDSLLNNPLFKREVIFCSASIFAILAHLWEIYEEITNPALDAIGYLFWHLGAVSSLILIIISAFREKYFLISSIIGGVFVIYGHSLIDTSRGDGFVSLVVHVVLISWTARGYLLIPIAYLVWMEISAYLHSGSLDYIIFLPVLVSIITGIGYFIRSSSHAIGIYETEVSAARERVFTIEEDIRNRLAADLHDVIAKEITRIFIEAEQLNRLDISDEALELGNQISISSQRAMSHIRTLIKSLNTDSQTLSLSKAIDMGKQTLRQRNIDLIIDIEEDVVASTQDEHPLFSLIVNEGILNIYKYGKSDSQAELIIVSEDNTILVSLISEIDPKRTFKEELSSGYGLKNLKVKLQLNGGQLNYFEKDGRWYLNATWLEGNEA